MRFDVIFGGKIEIAVTVTVHVPGLEMLALELKTAINNQGDRIMATLADIQAKVAAEKTVVDSAVALLTELNTELKAAIASNDPAALQALSDSIDANVAELSGAVVANTPAAPAPAA